MYRVLVHSLLPFIVVQFGLAQWSGDPTVNNPVCTEPGQQFSPQLVSDGAGGAIITWRDSRSGTTDSDIYCQRISEAGTVQWTANGVAICTASSDQFSPVITSDGANGAIIAWYDYRNGTANSDLYSQRINASGVAQWTANGVVISAASGDQSDPTIVSDGAGGAIIVWSDFRSGVDQGVYAQRVNASGGLQWTADGVVIADTIGDQFGACLVSDGAGGAIIAWLDNRNGPWFDIYAQRISASGVVQWTTNGVPICTVPYFGFTFSRSAQITDDGSGGALIAWNDPRSGVNDIYAQRINTAGVVQWTTNGVAICTATGDQSELSIAADGSGGAIIAWKDFRNGSHYDLYAQRVNASGVVQWAADGVAISAATDNQTGPQVHSQGFSGATITWTDGRGTTSDIYAQKVDLAGTTQWTANGVPVSTATGHQSYPRLISDGSTGVIISWQDGRSGTSNNDIYASRLFSDGGLPVQLASFTARHIPTTLHVLLEWMTLSEINNYGFFVERRKLTEQRFREIPNSFIPGHGTTVQPHHYSFLDSTVMEAGTYHYRLRQIDLDGTIHYLPEITIHIAVTTVNEVAPLFFRLEQNYPNPFSATGGSQPNRWLAGTSGGNSGTTIRFSVGNPSDRIPVSGFTSLKVYDMLGRCVATLVEEYLQPGTYTATWNPTALPSGVYLYRLEQGTHTAVKRMVLLK